MKKSLITKTVLNYRIEENDYKSYVPVSGDVALFEILEIGKHRTMQSDSKRNVALFPGDQILAAFGDRYATEQFEGYVPEQVMAEYHILGAGGVIGIVKSKNAAFKDIEPTKVRLIGFAVGVDNKIVNTKFYGIEKPVFSKETTMPKVVLSLGATMDSGKTTTAAFVSRGLYLAGNKVGFIKLTGTAYTKDKDFVFDAGAMRAMDFSDAGFPSTFTIAIPEILSIYEYLRKSIVAEGPLDYIVVEIADGILQQETLALISHPDFMSTITKVVFSCGDSLSALHGMKVLQGLGIEPQFLCGKFTMSELLIQEVKQYINIPVFTLEELEGKKANFLLN